MSDETFNGFANRCCADKTKNRIRTEYFIWIDLMVSILAQVLVFRYILKGNVRVLHYCCSINFRYILKIENTDKPLTAKVTI